LVLSTLAGKSKGVMRAWLPTRSPLQPADTAVVSAVLMLRQVSYGLSASIKGMHVRAASR
jgi:hypothetical protein